MALTKKVLIITYYWPPSGGSAVIRWLKFVKYLPESGWEPVIYTPVNPNPQDRDEELFNEIPAGIEVIKTKIREPYRLYKIFSKKKRTDKISAAFLSDKKTDSFTEKVSLWIRSNIFIPDARRFWIKPSVRYLSGYLRENPVDIIVSTGPPHSMHLIALKLKKKLSIRWIADFRDPWTNIDFYHQLKLTQRANKKHHKLEKEVIQTADRIITVGPTITEEYKKLGGKEVVTITNGFDEVKNTGKEVLDKEFSVLHLGSVPQTRNPEVLWEAVSELVSENKEFSKKLIIKFIGNIDYTVKESIKKRNLQDFVRYVDFVSHNDAQNEAKAAQVLLLLVNHSKNAKGILTNKFFEYLGAKRPILVIGPEDGDVAKILKETNAGVVVDFEDKERMKILFTDWYKLYSQNELKVTSKDIKKYSRRNLTKKLVEQFSL